MKKLIVIMCALLLSISSCTNNNKSDYLAQIEKEQAQKEANLSILADSIVSLSFNGMALGSSFSSSTQDAIKNNRITHIKYSPDKTGLSGRAKIYLSTKEVPLEVEVMITSLNDSISSICIISHNYEARNDLIDLYKAKYLEDYADFEHKSGSDSYVWSFENQTLRVSKLYETEQQVYVKDPRMKSPENRYGVETTNYFKSIVILYNDIRLCKEAKKLQEKEDLEAKIKAQQENEQRNKDMQDRANHQDI